MLKREEEREILEGVKIKIPNLEETNKLIKKLNEFKFMECYHNPTSEMETICFEIGKVVSDCIKSVLRNNIAQLMDTELKLIQVEAITRINAMSKKAKEINDLEKKNK